MKKAYTKPEIVFEDFSLCTGIASGCEIIIDNQSSGSCGYQFEGGNGMTMFTHQAGTDVCNVPSEDDDKKNTFCYQNPISTNNIFNS